MKRIFFYQMKIIVFIFNWNDRNLLNGKDKLLSNENNSFYIQLKW